MIATHMSRDNEYIEQIKLEMKTNYAKHLDYMFNIPYFDEDVYTKQHHLDKSESTIGKHIMHMYHHTNIFNNHIGIGNEEISGHISFSITNHSIIGLPALKKIIIATSDNYQLTQRTITIKDDGMEYETSTLIELISLNSHLIHHFGTIRHMLLDGGIGNIPNYFGVKERK
ncbi:MAG: hypothetical protein HRU03_09095 [Nanoarchaeales archaeon]|nr:hypothetical protein [Nanoarchaeales archaeon]